MQSDCLVLKADVFTASKKVSAVLKSIDVNCYLNILTFKEGTVNWEARHPW